MTPLPVEITAEAEASPDVIRKAREEGAMSGMRWAYHLVARHHPDLAGEILKAMVGGTPRNLAAQVAQR